MSTMITAAIGALALVGVLVIGIATDDSVASANGPGQSVPNTDGGPAVSGGGSSDGNSSGGGGTSSGGGGTSTTEVPSATTGGPAAGGGSSDLATDFPVPPGASAIDSYGSLNKTTGEKWYLSSSPLASVYSFYTTTFKAKGGTTYVDPLIDKDSSGNPTAVYAIYHFGTTTVDLELNANYLDVKPGTVLIRASVIA